MKLAVKGFTAHKDKAPLLSFPHGRLQQRWAPTRKTQYSVKTCKEWERDKRCKTLLKFYPPQEHNANFRHVKCLCTMGRKKVHWLTCPTNSLQKICKVFRYRRRFWMYDLLDFWPRGTKNPEGPRSGTFLFLNYSRFWSKDGQAGG